MKKGFTLIELLGVIVILGILVLVAFPPLLNQIKKSKEEIKETTKTLIIDAAKDYMKDNENNYKQTEGITYCLNINTLVENGYLNKKIKDENLNDLNESKKIKMIYHNNKYDYEIVNTCTNTLLTRNNIEIPIVTENSGLYQSQTEPDRLIYRGTDPQNYIELEEGTGTPSKKIYRIISFEPDGTIKVIRNTYITGRWDISSNTGTYETRNNDNNTYCKVTGTYNGCNVWGNIYNTYYDNSPITTPFYFKYYADLDSKMLTAVSYQGTVTDSSYLSKYLNTEWISANSNLDQYIQEHEYKVGGIHLTQTNTLPKPLEMEKQEESLYTWTGKIALANITEFVESSTNPACTSVNVNMRYNSNYYYDDNNDGTKDEHTPEGGWPCTNSENWLYTGTKEYSLTAASGARSNVWTVSDLGFFHGFATANNYKYRPVFYLKSSVNLTGEGSQQNPYKIQ